MTKRFGNENRMNSVLELDFWLVVKRVPRGTPGVRITAGYPAMARDERAINLKINLPFALFEAPSITARIDVDAPSQGVRINTAAIAEAVRQCIGMDVHIEVGEPA